MNLETSIPKVVDLSRADSDHKAVVVKLSFKLDAASIQKAETEFIKY